MKTVIVGAGSIGTRHAKLFQELTASEIFVVEPDQGRRDAFLQSVPARHFASLELALAERPDVAVICSPTSMHVSHCFQALRADSHVFVEKPVSNTLDGLSTLADEARSRERVVLVSCNFRFDPALAQIKEWLQAGLVGRPLTCRASFGQDLRQSRPGRDYRTVYASQKALGGGILLDSVHEIDYLSWLFGAVESVSAMAGKISDLEMDADDFSNLLLRFRSGTRVSVQLDYFRPEYNRSCEIIGTNGILQWSYSPKVARYYSSATTHWTSATFRAEAVDAMYARQITHFLACVDGRAEPVLDLSGGEQLLRVLLGAAESAEAGHEVRIPSPSDGKHASEQPPAFAVGGRTERQN